MTQRLDVTVGEYQINFQHGRLMVFRYGEFWKDATGDNCLLALAYEVDRLRERYEQYPDLRRDS